MVILARNPVMRQGPLRAGTILGRARQLRRAARSGEPTKPLKGRNLALLYMQDGPDAELFREAGSALGAHVSTVRATFCPTHSPAEIDGAARLLGKLYDGIECQGVAPEIVRKVSAVADVPVYDAIAARKPLTASSATQGTDDQRVRRNRLFVVQAVLVESLA